MLLIVTNDPDMGLSVHILPFSPRTSPNMFQLDTLDLIVNIFGQLLMTLQSICSSCFSLITEAFWNIE